jgi:hypothetical protein
MNNYGLKAKDYLAQYCPTWYSEIEDKEAYFIEIGNTAESQVSSIYSRLSRPELGGNDPATRQMAEETIRELLYPPPERHRRTADWAKETEEDFDDEANPAAGSMLDGVQMQREMLLAAD